MCVRACVRACVCVCVCVCVRASVWWELGMRLDWNVHGHHKKPTEPTTVQLWVTIIQFVLLDQRYSLHHTIHRYALQGSTPDMFSE